MRRTDTRLGMAVILTLAGTLAGCMPAYRAAPPQSQITAPAQWREPVTGSEAVQANWWRAFGDPQLTALVEQALARNTDVLTAVARVDQARAQAHIADSARWPALNATMGEQSARALGSTGIAITHSVQPAVQASWEVDLWGRLHQQAKAANLQYQATQAEREGVALAVAATTSQSYIALLALDAQLRITRETAASRARALELAQGQEQVGYISELELTQSQSEYEAIMQAIPQLEQSIRRQENALRILVGDIPGEVLRGGRLQDLHDLQLPASLPSELLERRPDIAQASLMLAASDANLAARRAEFLPRVSISASLGELFIDALNYDPMTVWSLGGSILAPLFSAGRLTAQVDAATAQRDQAAYAYRGVVLNAFGEVENALSDVSRLQQQMDHAEKRRDILQRSLVYAQDRYQAGYASYLNELDAQRNLYQMQLTVVTLRQSQLDNFVNLYRALGGGYATSWTVTGAAPPR